MTAPRDPDAQKAADARRITREDATARGEYRVARNQDVKRDTVRAWLVNQQGVTEYIECDSPDMAADWIMRMRRESVDDVVARRR